MLDPAAKDSNFRSTMRTKAEYTMLIVITKERPGATGSSLFQDKEVIAWSRPRALVLSYDVNALWRLSKWSFE